MAIDVKTQSGFCWSLDEDVMDDIELLDGLAALDRGEAVELPNVIKSMLGEDGRAALYEHIRTESGRVPISRAIAELGEIIESLKDSKAKK